MQGNQTKGKRCTMDLISRQALCEYALNQKDKSVTPNDIMRFPSAQPDNQVSLCDSCKHTYPDCPSQSDDVIFGNGNGDDNICACAKYVPSVQQELEHTMEEFMYGQDMGNPEDGSL